LGAALAVARFLAARGHRHVNALLGLPSVVVGLAVYLLLSRAGPLGAFGILFTPAAMVIAQAILVLPLIAALTRQAISDAWQETREQLRSLGAGPFASATALLWDLRFSLVTIVLAGFGRAVSEVGAVMIVGGNIDGVTRVMTTAIALETSKGDLPLALGLGISCCRSCCRDQRRRLRRQRRRATSDDGMHDSRLASCRSRWDRRLSPDGGAACRPCCGCVLRRGDARRPRTVIPRLRTAGKVLTAEALPRPPRAHRVADRVAFRTALRAARGATRWCSKAGALRTALASVIYALAARVAGGASARGGAREASPASASRRFPTAGTGVVRRRAAAARAGARLGVAS
jgi:ABC-type tungstate transport system substrate-binding protein